MAAAAVREVIQVSGLIKSGYTIEVDLKQTVGGIWACSGSSSFKRDLTCE